MYSLNYKFAKKINKYNFFYGWIIVAIASLGIFTSGAGQSHTFSPFVPVISKDLKISSSLITTAYMIATLIAAFLLPQMGNFIDKYGPRVVLIYTIIFLGIGCIIFGAASSFLMLSISFGFLRFFGQGTLMLGSANIVTQWFNKKRGLALGLMGLGFAISMGLHPVLSDYLITHYGWRQAWVIIGFTSWIAMLPPLFLLAINKPEDLGLLPDGLNRNNFKKDKYIFGLTLNDALREKSFYILSFSFFSISSLVTALHFFQVTILNQYLDMQSSDAAKLFLPTMIVMIFSIPIIGKMLDIFQTHNIIGLALLITTCSLISITYANNFEFALIYSIIFGINNAFNLSLFGYIWPRYFGRRHVGSIQGTGQMILVVGASIGAIPFAIAMDMGFDLLATIRISAIYPFFSAFLCFFFLRESGKLRNMQTKRS